MLRKLFVFFAFCVGCCLAVTAQAKEGSAPNQLTKQEKADGWQLLFDGKSVDGWMHWPTRQPLEPGKWVARDGALVLAGKGGGDIYTAKPYENFELQLEWKTTGNSGLLFRVDPSSKGPIWKVAPEMQILRDGGKKSTSAGGLYALYDIEGKKIIHPDGWNQVRLKVHNDQVTGWFNGEQVYTFKIGSDDWNARVAKSKFAKNQGFGETAKGHIGLQDHGHEVAFRNVKIRKLD